MEPWSDDSLNWPIHLNLACSCGNETILYSNRVSCTDKPDPGNQRIPSFSWYCQTTQRNVALNGCHDQVGHLNLEHMLNLMCDQFFWPCMAAQAKEHIRKCCLCLAFKAKQPKASLWKYHGHTIPWSLSTLITCVWNQGKVYRKMFW